MTFVVRVTQRTRLSVTLLAEAWPVWTGDLGTLEVYAVVGAMFVFLGASRVKAGVVFSAIVGRARH